MKLFVSGIDTGVGKTIASAVLVEALKADYWKPVQAGDLDNSDSISLADMITNSITKIHAEKHALTVPASPHFAAEQDGVLISDSDFKLPKTENEHLIVEGAGGLMVPLNKDYLIIDLIKDLDLSVVLVSKNYLGSINHTLLSADKLKKEGIPFTILFNGEENLATESVIAYYTKAPILGRINWTENANKQFIQQEADRLKEAIKSLKI